MLKKCNRCGEEKDINEFYSQSTKCKLCQIALQKVYIFNNKMKICQYKKKYYQKNKEKLNQHKKEYNKEYYEKNKDKLNQKKNNYQKKRRKNDPIFNLLSRLRSRNRGIIKAKNLAKNKNLLDYLGCTGAELKIHIEKQFKDGMTWENRNEWHLDHIIPISTAETIEDVYRLNHYSNIQPLWGKENIVKGNKLNWKNEEKS